MSDEEVYTESTSETQTIRPMFLAWCIIALSLFISIGTYFHYQVFIPYEQPYRLEFLSTKRLKEFGGIPGIVHVGLALDSFQTFDMSTGAFVVDGLLWFWFDPLLVALEEIDKVSIANGSFLQKSQPFTTLVHDRLFVQYGVRISFRNMLNYTQFPDDDHRLFILLTHPNLTPGELIFEANSKDFVMRADFSREGWALHDVHADVGYVSSSVHTSFADLTYGHPAVAFGIDVRRDSLRTFLTILFPMLVMLTASLGAWTIEPMHWGSRMSLTLQSIVGLIAFRFVLDSMSPRTAYFLVSDLYFLIFLMAYLVIFFANLAGSRMTRMHARLLVMGITVFVGLSALLVWKIH